MVKWNRKSIPEVEIVHEAFRTNSVAIGAAFHGLDAVELPLMFDRRGEERTSFLAWGFQELFEIGHGGGVSA